MNNETAALGLAYLATPYSRYVGGIAPAFADACKLAAKLMMCGVKVYSPIVHCHSLAMYGVINPLDHNIWLPFDMAMMTAADVLIVAHMDGWQESYGIGEEVKFFEAAGKPIFDLDPATLMMVRRNPDDAVTDEPSNPRLALLNHLKAKSDTKPHEVAMALVAERDKEIESYPLAHNKTRSQQGGSSV